MRYGIVCSIVDQCYCTIPLLTRNLAHAIEDDDFFTELLGNIVYPKRSFVADFRPRIEGLQEYREAHPIPGDILEKVSKGDGDYDKLFNKSTTIFPKATPDSMLSAIHLLFSLYSIAKNDQRQSAKAYVASAHRSSAHWKALFQCARDKEDDMQVAVMRYATEIVSSCAVQDSPAESEVLMKIWLDSDLLAVLETSLWLHTSTHILPTAFLFFIVSPFYAL